MITGALSSPWPQGGRLPGGRAEGVSGRQKPSSRSPPRSARLVRDPGPEHSADGGGPAASLTSGSAGTDPGNYHLPRGETPRGCLGSDDRMAVIFGFGPGNPEDLGEVALCVCPNCHNQILNPRPVEESRVPVLRARRALRDGRLPGLSRLQPGGLQVTGAQLRYVMSLRRDRFVPRRAAHPGPVYGAGRAVLASARGKPRRPAALHSGRPGAPAAAQPASPVRSPATAEAPPVAADDQTSWMSQWRRACQLHDQGVLSDAAYTAAKLRIWTSRAASMSGHE